MAQKNLATKTEIGKKVNSLSIVPYGMNFNSSVIRKKYNSTIRLLCIIVYLTGSGRVFTSDFNHSDIASHNLASPTDMFCFEPTNDY